MSEIIEAEVIEKPMSNIVPFAPNLPISRANLDALAESRKIVASFIQGQLRDGVDFGVVPGTKLPSLYKPGAEKFCKLFNLTIKLECVDKIIDRTENFAMFTYRATVCAADGRELAQVEGSCNSQEKKYKERKKYLNNKDFEIEQTPICDILNTLMKMAQKRAKVGGVIEAVGASDFYTQDIEDSDEAEQVGIARPVVQKADVQVPKVTQAKTDGSVEICDCGNQMMVSKFNPNELYCNLKAGGCGAKRNRA